MISFSLSNSHEVMQISWNFLSFCLKCFMHLCKSSFTVVRLKKWAITLMKWMVAFCNWYTFSVEMQRMLPIIMASACHFNWLRKSAHEKRSKKYINLIDLELVLKSIQNVRWLQLNFRLQTIYSLILWWSMRCSPNFWYDYCQSLPILIIFKTLLMKSSFFVAFRDLENVKWKTIFGEKRLCIFERKSPFKISRYW